MLFHPPAPELPEVLIDEDTVAQYDGGYRPTQRNLLISQGKYPRPVFLSVRKRAWLLREILAWQRERIAKRDAA